MAAFGVPPSTTGFDPVFRRTNKEELTHVHLAADDSPLENLALSGAVFYSAYELREDIFQSADFQMKRLTTTADSSEIGGIASAHTRLGAADTLAVAVQGRGSNADIGDTINGTLSRPDVATTSVGFENVYTVNERIVVLVGTSFDVQTGGGRGTEFQPNPQAGVSVDFGRFGTSRFSVSRKTRFPTLRELFDPLQGNANLDAEKSLTYEAGHRWGMERLSLDLALFRSDVDDLIETSGGADPQPAMNVSQAVLQGVEVALQSSPLGMLRFDANYTFLDAEAEQGSGGTLADIQHRPAHRFNGIVQIFMPFETRLRLEGLYTSEQIDRFGTDVNIDGFGLFNAQLAATVYGCVEVVAGADNLLDEDYEERLGTPQPGRWFYLGFRITEITGRKS
jgi:outer membrane receptor protein involved in Fe transport